MYSVVLVFLLLLLVVVPSIDGQLRRRQRCSAKNDPAIEKRFGDKAIDDFCGRETRWKQRSIARADSPKVRLSSKQFQWLTDVWSCEDLSCVCQFEATGTCGKLVSEVTEVIKDATDKLQAIPTDVDNAVDNVAESLGIGGAPGTNGKSNVDFLQVVADGKRRPIGIPDIGALGKGAFGDLLGGRSKRQSPQQLMKLKPAVRKEYRMMSDEERRVFHEALNDMKTQTVDGMSKYDILIVYHTPEYSPGAHFGAALLPFHRELLKQLELVLRTSNPLAALPYWDNTLDEPLPTPEDSVLWTEDFFGNDQGEVTTGPFGQWVTVNDSAVGHLNVNRKIMRQAGANQFGGFFRPEDMKRIMEYKNFEDLTYCVDPYFEMVHGTVHMWVGGHMGQTRISPNDPTFFLLHSFIDYIWERWRVKQQPSTATKESSYPSDARSCNQFHFKDEPMKPFNRITNGAGLSTRYTRELYTYEDTPTCSASSPECGSKWIFCDTRSYVCVSKVRANGNCRGFETEDICYNGRCVNGRCNKYSTTETPSVTVPPTTRTTTRRPFTTTTTAATTTRRTTTTTRPSLRTRTTTRSRPTAPPTSTAAPFSTDVVYLPITVLSIRSGAVQPYQAAQIVADHDDGQVIAGQFVNRFDSHYYSGAAVASVRSPYTTGKTEATLYVFDERSKPCVSMCLNGRTRPWRYDTCTANVSLSSDPRSSSTTPFTSERDDVHLLAWDESGAKTPDEFMFICHARAGTALVPDGQTRTTTARPTPRPPKRTTVTPKGKEECTDLHRCCFMFASDKKECRRNVWMKSACRKSCGLCAITAQPRRAATSSRRKVVVFPRSGRVFVQGEGKSSSCVDVYPSADCARWAGNKQCRRNADWMEVNCAKSCRVCDRSSEAWGKICGVAKKADDACLDYDSSCASWSAKGECSANGWWMEHNCPKACSLCH